MQNRGNDIGHNLTAYTDALKRLVIDKPDMSVTESANRSLLLVSFRPFTNIPDRGNILKYLAKQDPHFHHEMDISHAEWLRQISNHKFVLAPFGHGLDTHRLSEILMMGGIPVTRRSTISSCFDDTDNNFNGLSRGSLPILILDSWANLTKQTLDSEWERISKLPTATFDYKRVFLNHWLERIDKITT